MQTTDLFGNTAETPQRTTTNEVHEAFAKYGAKSLSDIQLLTLFGIPETAARQLLQDTGNSLAALAKRTTIEIAAIKGIGEKKAAAIIAALEMGRRRQIEQPMQKGHIVTSIDCYDMVHPQMRDLTQEVFWIFLLDRRSKVIKIEEIHKGGMSSMVVDPKIIFQKALEYKASSLILCHNHPSGSPSPSMEDIRLTEKVKLAGTYIDIKVLDHIIIGDGSYYSFADEGKM